MPKADKKKLINRPRVDDGVVTIPGVGDFRIRPLSRAEALRIMEVREASGIPESEALLVHLGLTDPTFTLDEVRAWEAEPGSSAELQPISQALAKISGLTPDSGKGAYKSAG